MEKNSNKKRDTRSRKQRKAGPFSPKKEGTTGVESPKEVLKKERVVKLPKRIPSKQEIMQEAAGAQQIMNKRAQEEAEKAMYKMFESKFGLTQDKIEATVALEASLADPKNKVKSVEDALDVYSAANLDNIQYIFMAVNANSRANMHQNNAGAFYKDLQVSRQQLDALMSLTQLKIEAENVLETQEDIKANASAEDSAKEVIIPQTVDEADSEEKTTLED